MDLSEVRERKICELLEKATVQVKFHNKEEKKGPKVNKEKKKSYIKSATYSIIIIIKL